MDTIRRRAPMPREQLQYVWVFVWNSGKRTGGSNQMFLTTRPREKIKQNTLFKRPIIRSEYLFSTFKIFSSYGLILYMLNNSFTFTTAIAPLTNDNSNR
jgi:hypothetical protein